MALHKQLTTALSALTLATLSACGGGSGGGSGGNGGGSQAIDTSPKFQIFTGFDGASGTIKSSNDVAIYKTNGTQSGTTVLKEDVSVYSGGTSRPMHFDNGNKMIFAGQTKNSGIEPWVTDGTPEGTRLLKDIAPNSANSLTARAAGVFSAYNGKVYFAATKGGSIPSLYETDGTPNNTKALFSYTSKTLTHNSINYQASEVSAPLVFPQGIYLILYEANKSPSSPSTKRVLARYNLNSQSFEFVTKVVVGSTFIPFKFNEKTYIVLKSGLTQLSGNTLKTILPNVVVSNVSMTRDYNLTEYSSAGSVQTLHLIGVDKTDRNAPKAVLIKLSKEGTASTTELKAPSYIPGNVGALQFTEGLARGGTSVQLKDGLYAAYQYTSYRLAKMFVKINFDGSSEAIKNVGQTTGGYNENQVHIPLAAFDNFAVTQAESTENINTCTGREPWKMGNNQYDLLKNINPSQNRDCRKRSSEPVAIGKVGTNKLIFAANNGTANGKEAWVTDGTANGTQLLKDINPGSGTGVHGRAGDLNAN